ncbi:MAG: ATP-binding protein [Bacteroidales bacterium]|nr:ATP-binding protein [Bacteroidales bacterium]
MKKHKEIKIESSLDEMFQVEQFVEEISEEFLLYGNYFGNILMGVSEAVKNAIFHGNGQDRKKFVRIMLENTKDGLWIKVFDEGEGFDYKAYANRGNSGVEFGSDKNGLHLIQALADEVKFKDKGRLIEMLFRIYGIDENIFERRVVFMQDFFRVYQRLNS